MTQLRPYQSDAVDAVLAAWDRGSCCPLVSLPTGTGKSLVLAELVRRLLAADGDMRVLVASHVAELLNQDEAALLRLWPDARTGIYCAGLGRKEADAPVVFGSVQSLFRNPEVIGRRDLVIVDEAHLVPYADDSQYRKLIAGLREAQPGFLIYGLSATPFRLSSGLLTSEHDGKPPLFTEIAYEAKLADMIAQGWLAPLSSKGTTARLNVQGVGTKGGEFIAGELANAVNRPDVNRAAVDEIVYRGAERKSWLVFCCGIDHAGAIATLLRERGISCRAILGDTASDDRTDAIAAFKAGRIRCLVSVGVLTTGFDAPNVDLIVALRPTKSPGLWLQMLGRGMRLKTSGARDCTVLDFAGNVKRLGPAVEIDGSTTGADGIEARAKSTARDNARECPACTALVSLSAKACVECGFVFPIIAPFIDAEASGLDVLTDTDSKWFDVRRVTYRVHEKPGGKPSLRIQYDVGLFWPISDFKAFESPAARPWVEKWWAQTGGNHPVPADAYDALRRSGELRQPVEIRAREDGKYWKITRRKFERGQEAA